MGNSLSFVVSSIQLSFHTSVFTYIQVTVFSIQIIRYFNQTVPRVYTSALFIIFANYFQVLFALIVHSALISMV